MQHLNMEVFDQNIIGCQPRFGHVDNLCVLVVMVSPGVSFTPQFA